nr:MAG TPA: hypothetical protein [Caudoviricetes sp.]
MGYGRRFLWAGRLAIVRAAFRLTGLGFVRM